MKHVLLSPKFHCHCAFTMTRVNAEISGHNTFICTVSHLRLNTCLQALNKKEKGGGLGSPGGEDSDQEQDFTLTPRSGTGQQEQTQMRSRS